MFNKEEFNVIEKVWKELKIIINNYSFDNIIIKYEEYILKIIFVGEKIVV